MKKVKAILCVVALTSALTGCSMIIPFQRLLETDSNDKTTQVEPVGEVPKVVSINLGSTDTESDNLDQFLKVSKSLEEKLKNNATSGTKQTFNLNQNDVFSNDYISEVKNGIREDVIINVLEDIYKTPNRKVYSTTLVGLGKEVVNNNEAYKLIIDINAVDDDLGFHIQRVNLYLNNNKMITDIKRDGEIRDEVNTVNPISKNSKIDTFVNNEFQKNLKVVLTSMSNKPLYDKLVQEGKNGESSEFKSFISKIDIKNKDISSLYDMFKSGKGEFENYSITSYMHKDIDVEPITTYVVTIPYEGGESSFKIDFNRINNKITAIVEV